jgi:chromosomal replication initiator protein
VTSHDKEIGQRLLDAIETKMGIERYEVWFGGGTRVRVGDDKITIVVQSEQTTSGQNHNTSIKLYKARFREEIDNAVMSVFGEPRTVEFVFADQNYVGEKNDIIYRADAKHSVSSVPVLVGAEHGGSSFGAALIPPLRLFQDNQQSNATFEQNNLPQHIKHVKQVTPSIGGRPRNTYCQPAKTPTNTTNVSPKSQQSKPNYVFETLETFVKGASNNLARQAADFAIQYPGKINPIYIHGATSVGKTHLLRAIWNEARRQKTHNAPLFVTCEQFTNHFIDSMTKNGMPSFRNKFRDISILILDDLPFIAGKKATQSELMNLIDTLKGRGVQLVFSGDRPLGQLAGIRSEILSRLESGMSCEIKQPESAMLFEICRSIAKQREIPITDEVCRFITSRLNQHARQISGALNLLHAVNMSNNGKPITIQQTEETLNELVRWNRRSVRIQDIDAAVCKQWDLPHQELQSKGRAKAVTQPRMIAMWLARKHTKSALIEIGKYFGNRSHSTVVTAQQKVDLWIKNNETIICNGTEYKITELLQLLERKWS